jgi:hypothetical protein
MQEIKVVDRTKVPTTCDDPLVMAIFSVFVENVMISSIITFPSRTNLIY